MTLLRLKMKTQLPVHCEILYLPYLEKMRINFAGELLHFSNPRQYWLWTNWIWDPDANTGSLPLVVQEEVDLLGDTPGETYMRVGQAMAQVRQAGQQRGFSNLVFCYQLVAVDVLLVVLRFLNNALEIFYLMAQKKLYLLRD